MTEDRFFDVLRHEGDDFQWKIETGRYIRARLDIFGITRTFCPLTAAAYVLEGKIYSPVSWSTAALILGISADTATCILHAADKPESELNPEEQRLRRRMIEEFEIGEPVGV